MFIVCVYIYILFNWFHSVKFAYLFYNYKKNICEIMPTLVQKLFFLITESQLFYTEDSSSVEESVSAVEAVTTVKEQLRQCHQWRYCASLRQCPSLWASQLFLLDLSLARPEQCWCGWWVGAAAPPDAPLRAISRSAASSSSSLVHWSEVGFEAAAPRTDVACIKSASGPLRCSYNNTFSVSS